MTTLFIQTGQNNPILRKKAKQVKEVNAQIKQLALDMIETMEAKDGLGLAAPQVNQLLCIIVAKADPNKESLILINPEIKKVSHKKEIMKEGCLSLPNLSVPIERPAKITVKGLNINGQPIKLKVQGLWARIIQHEIDHLSGILIVDKSNPVPR